MLYLFTPMRYPKYIRVPGYTFVWPKKTVSVVSHNPGVTRNGIDLEREHRMIAQSQIQRASDQHWEYVLELDKTVVYSKLHYPRLAA